MEGLGGGGGGLLLSGSKEMADVRGEWAVDLKEA